MKIYRRSFEREFVRIFGQHKFTSTVEFEGYSPFWTAIISAAPEPSRRIVFLHNDMRSEWLSKHPQLEVSFRLYPSYDALVSVSQAVSEENREHLGSFLSLGDQKFVHAVNQINPIQDTRVGRWRIWTKTCLIGSHPTSKPSSLWGGCLRKRIMRSWSAPSTSSGRAAPTSRLVILWETDRSGRR